MVTVVLLVLCPGGLGEEGAMEDVQDLTLVGVGGPCFLTFSGYTYLLLLGLTVSY